MAQYIDKSALVVEIKERIKTYNKGYANGDDRRADALEVLLHDIDTLEVKEVNSNDTLIEKAEDYLNSQLYDWVSITNPNQRSCANVIPKRDFIEDFRNYMKRIKYVDSFNALISDYIGEELEDGTYLLKR